MHPYLQPHILSTQEYTWLRRKDRIVPTGMKCNDTEKQMTKAATENSDFKNTIQLHVFGLWGTQFRCQAQSDEFGHRMWGTIAFNFVALNAKRNEVHGLVWQLGESTTKQNIDLVSICVCLKDSMNHPFYAFTMVTLLCSFLFSLDFE